MHDSHYWHLPDVPWCPLCFFFFCLAEYLNLIVELELRSILMGRAIGFANFFSVMFCVVKIYISMYCLLLVTCNYRHLLYTETSHSCRKGVVINLSCTGSKTRCKPNLSPSLTLSEYKKSFCLCLQSQHSMAQQCNTSFSPIWRTQLCHLCRFDTIM
jgi:hypothetical protein